MTGSSRQPDDEASESGVRTFEQLGLDFPLFRAPATQCGRFEGPGICSVFREADDHCFRVDTIVVACADCGREHLVGLSDPANARCDQCETPLNVPTVDYDDLLAPYRAIATGRACFRHDTELGTLDAEAFLARDDPRSAADQTAPRAQTVTLGAGFVMTDTTRDGGARLWTMAEEDLRQLLATPTSASLQEPVWLVHCNRPMVFQIGTMLIGVDSFPEDLRERVIEDICGQWGDDMRFPEHSGLYLFICQECGVLRSHIDY